MVVSLNSEGGHVKRTIDVGWETEIWGPTKQGWLWEHPLRNCSSCFLHGTGSGGGVGGCGSGQSSSFPRRTPCSDYVTFLSWVQPCAQLHGLHCPELACCKTESQINTALVMNSDLHFKKLQALPGPKPKPSQVVPPPPGSPSSLNTTKSRCFCVNMRKLSSWKIYQEAANEIMTWVSLG